MAWSHPILASATSSSPGSDRITSSASGRTGRRDTGYVTRGAQEPQRICNQCHLLSISPPGGAGQQVARWSRAMAPVPVVQRQSREGHPLQDFRPGNACRARRSMEPRSGCSGRATCLSALPELSWRSRIEVSRYDRARRRCRVSARAVVLIAVPAVPVAAGRHLPGRGEGAGRGRRPFIAVAGVAVAVAAACSGRVIFNYIGALGGVARQHHRLNRGERHAHSNRRHSAGVRTLHQHHDPPHRDVEPLAVAEADQVGGRLSTAFSAVSHQGSSPFGDRPHGVDPRPARCWWRT